MNAHSFEGSPEPRPAPAPRPSRRSALWLWFIAGVGLPLISLASIPLSRAMAGLDSQLELLIYNLIYYLCFAALPLYLLARRRPGLWQAYRPYPISIFAALSIVALALLGVLLVTDLSALWAILLEALGLRPGGSGAILPTSARGLALCVLYSAVLPAVCEEFLFRGAMLSALERGGTRRAVVLTALMFALLHGSLAGLPLQFLTGAILGWLVIYCDSIYAGLIYHTTHNAATLIFQFLALRNASASAAAQPTRMIDAVGGASGALQLLVEAALLGLMLSLSMRMFRGAARLRGTTIEPPRPRERLCPSEWAPLLLGIAVVALLFVSDIRAMLAGGAP